MHCHQRPRHPLGHDRPGRASRLVIELEQLGYVVRAPSPSHRRTHLVGLTRRGLALVEAGRAARAAFTQNPARGALGPAALERLLGLLRRVANHTGGLETLTSRRIRRPV
jgi:DNA-binding MarR family transcriptional regulator